MTGTSPPRLLDRVRAAVRLRHMSRRTEKAYVGWVRRFVLFHGKRHPAEMGPAEITAFLSSRATEGRVAASTQNQALAALLFLYRVVLEKDVPWLDGLVRARHSERLPVDCPGRKCGCWSERCAVCLVSWPRPSTGRVFVCSSAPACG